MGGVGAGKGEGEGDGEEEGQLERSRDGAAPLHHCSLLFTIIFFLLLA